MDIYYLNVEFLNDDDIFNKNLEQMSEYRQRKINAFRFRKDKNLSLGAGILIDRGLEKYGLSESKMKIITGKNGKPYFADSPEIFFSISHSGSMAAAAFSENEIGCDIEKIAVHDLSIAKRFFTEKENDFIISAPDEAEMQCRFVRVWTLKESYIKATGHGMSLPLNSFEIIPSTVISEDLSLSLSTGGKTYRFQEFGEIPDYCLAVCEKTEQ